MNLNLYNPKSLIFCSCLILFISNCSQEVNTEEVFADVLGVDPNTSLDCTGIWEGSPLCLERNEALVALKRLDGLMLALENNDSSQEGANILAAAINQRQEADKKYFEEFYFKARDIYQEASNSIESYNNEKSSNVSSQILYLQNLLDTFQLNEAKNLLDKALLANQSNQDLIKIKNRIDVFDEVSSLNINANNELDKENFSIALDIITQSFNLDPLRKDTISLKDRINSEGNEFFFKSFLKEAYSLTDASDITNAKIAFENAKRIFSNRQEISAARSYIDKKSKEINLKNLNTELSKSIKNENWSIAKSALLSMIEINPLDDNSINLLSRVEKLEKLDNEISTIIQKPERLSSKNIRDNLSNSIASAKLLNLKNEKKFLDLLVKAEDILKQYGSMVNLVIRSNNNTVVEIVRTTTLDPFEIKNLELYPGTYTIVAKKKGMRSSRLDINLEPSSKGLTVIAQCEAVCEVTSSGTTSNLNIPISKISPNNENDQSLNSSLDSTPDNSFSKYTKLNSASFSKAIECNRATNNRPFKITFKTMLTDTGRVKSAVLKKIDLDGGYLTPNEEDQYVAVVVKNALLKTKYSITSRVYLPKEFEIEQTLKIPSNFCVE